MITGIVQILLWRQLEVITKFTHEDQKSFNSEKEYVNILLATVCYIVSVSGSEVGAPRILPPTSGKHSWSGSGPTLPSASTLTGYFRRCPCNVFSSSAVNLLQLSSAISFTNSTHSKLDGSLKRSSTIPRCSAQREVLYPYTCKQHIVH